MSDIARTDRPVERIEGDDTYRREMQRLRHEANNLAASQLVRKDLRGRPDDVFAIALTAKSMGIPLSLTTLNQFAVINGVAVPMGQLLIGMAARAGHEIRVEERSAERAVVVLRNGRTGRDHRVTYTMDEAGSTTKGNEVWAKYPADMLVWRAVRRAVRIGAPEIAAGFGAEVEPPRHLAPLGRRIDRLGRRLDALHGHVRAELVERWEKAGLPAVHELVDEDVDVAEDLVDDVIAWALEVRPIAADLGRGGHGAQGDPATGRGHPHETPTPPEPSPAGTRSAPRDGPPAPRAASTASITSAEGGPAGGPQLDLGHRS